MASIQRLRLGMLVNYRLASGAWRPARVFGITGTQVNLRRYQITGGTYPNYTYGFVNLNGGALVPRAVVGPTFTSGTYPNYVYDQTGEAATIVYRTYRGN